MQKEGGVFSIPCSVNGLKLKFIFDTGASDVSISLTEALFMLKNGYLKQEDIIGENYYSDATGKISAGTNIIIRKIEFNGLVLRNVRASIVHQLAAPLLLGQSAMSQLGTFQLNPNNGILVIVNGTNSDYKKPIDDELTEQKESVNNANSIYKKINVTNSKIYWIGRKVSGQHQGTLELSDGTLIFKGKKLTGGTFTVDMTTIVVTDLRQNEGKEKLEGHLKSKDFFGSDEFRSSTLVFKTIAAKANNTYTVTAVLTIKNKTNPITFDIVVVGNTATTNLKIDRTKYDIKYGSGSFFDNLGDKAISDNFDLAVNLQF
jgi:clan AA aspartic protease (TIGR02281 family)